MNDGVCNNLNSTYTCTCPQYWKGKDCEEYNYCYNSPCHNNGTCVNGRNSFSCLCPSGFLGHTCDVVDQCLSGPCQNNGTCLLNTTMSSYVCKCHGGFVGEHCEKDRDECTTDVCPAKSTCYNEDGGYRCIWERRRKRETIIKETKSGVLELSKFINTRESLTVNIVTARRLIEKEMCNSKTSIFEPTSLSFERDGGIFLYFNIWCILQA